MNPIGGFNNYSIETTISEGKHSTVFEGICKEEEGKRYIFKTVTGDNQEAQTALINEFFLLKKLNQYIPFQIFSLKDLIIYHRYQTLMRSLPQVS